MQDGQLRIAAVSDLHYGRHTQSIFQPLFAHANDNADVLLLCGDLTDYGTPEEAHHLAKELSGGVRIPVLAVLGNHDFHSGQQDEVARILTESGAQVLNGASCEVHGVGFAGVKGFAGGFGQRTLEPWGEDTIKKFVHDAIDEALKLEQALARLGTAQRIALLHYAPIQATVEGEPEAIFPFMGSSRLEEPINRYQVTAVFHGHAHHGRHVGKTSSGIPVYNVALPVLREVMSDLPLCLIEVAVSRSKSKA